MFKVLKSTVYSFVTINTSKSVNKCSAERMWRQPKQTMRDERTDRLRTGKVTPTWRYASQVEQELPI